MKIRKSFRLLGLTLAIGILSIGSALAKQGGISGGGGGGVAPVNPAGPALIEQALREAPLALSLYFNFRETAELQKPTPVGKILFAGRTTIHELLKSSPIETSGGCRDPLGKKRDGAAPGKRPQSICMDVRSLGGKLTEDNYWAQTVALAGHELSHLLGTNEREASELQSDILAKLRFSPNFKAVSIRNSFLFDLGDLRREVEKARLASEGKPPLEQQGIWAKAAGESGFLQGRELKPWEGLQLLSPEAFWLGRALAWKIEYLNAGLFINGGGHSPNWEDALKRAFGGRNETNLATLAKGLEYKVVPAEVAGVKIERIGTPGAYEREVASIVYLIQKLDTLARSGPAAWNALIDKDSLKPKNNRIKWQAANAYLEASDFFVQADGKKLGVDLSSLSLSTSSSMIEATWQENGVEMRVFIYLRSNGTEWYSDEIRTYDGSKEGNWIYYYGDYFRTPLGQEFRGDVTLAGWNEDKQVGLLRFKDLRLKYEPKQE